MSLAQVLAYIEAGTTNQPVDLVVQEVDLAEHYGCTLTEGARYRLTHNGRHTLNGAHTLASGYQLWHAQYVLQDDKGGMFLVVFLECEITGRLGIVLARSNAANNPFALLLASGTPCNAN